MTSLNTRSRNSKVTKKPTPKKQSEEDKYKLREKIIQQDENRQKKLHLHPVNLTDRQVKDTKPQPPYDR